MKILRIIGSLDPQNGGPVAAAVFQTKEMLRQGHQVAFVTSDSSDQPFLSEVPGLVFPLGPAKGNYGYNPRLIQWLKIHAPEYDTVIVHGIWQFHSLAAWLASRQAHFEYFIYTHGMLDPWFKHAYPTKHVKKSIYWWLAEFYVLKNAKGVLFTSEEERILARESFWPYKVNEIVVDYGVALPPNNKDQNKELFWQTFPNLRGAKPLLFLGRLHPKKGCDLLIEALSLLKDEAPELHLIMAGPDADNWEPQLHKLAEDYGVTDKITWTGMLSAELKWGAYSASDAFILPSHSENFGVALVEALASGLPALITNKVNSWHTVKEYQAGFVSDDTLEGVVSLIRQWIALSEAEKNKMRKKAWQCFLQYYEISKTVRNFMEEIES